MLDPIGIADKVVEITTGKDLMEHGKDLLSDAGDAVSGAINNGGGNKNMGKRLDNIVGAVTGTDKNGRGGDKIADVIKYEGDNETFIWKHPIEDFNTGSQLIVHESQEAVFFMNGQALDLFGPGRHTLETQNLPLVGKFFKAPTGGRTPFHCEVYFINKTEQLGIKWGTPSQIPCIDPVYNMPILVGASGEMSLRVDDSRKLLVKIVGTERGITQQGFVEKMRGILQESIQANLAKYINEEKIDIITIEQHYPKIAGDLRAIFQPKFLEYGVVMEMFAVARIKRDEDENYKKLMELRAAEGNKALDQLNVDRSLIQYGEQVGKRLRDTDVSAYNTERMGAAEGERLRQMGITRQEEMQLEAINTMAGNEAIGQMTNTGIGLGMMTGVGFGVGGAVGGMVSNAMGDALKPQQGQQQSPIATNNCLKCGSPLPDRAKFCLECGQAALADNEILCPSCGVKTPKGKFCFECGTSMIKKCSNCSSDIPANGKFCLECGSKVE